MQTLEFPGKSAPHKNEAGLTLIELLVTIVILSFVIVLISGSLTQISRIIETASTQNNGFLDRWNQVRAMHDIIANMVIDPQQEIPFSASEKSITLSTTAPPDAPRGIPKVIHINLKQDQKSTALSFQNQSKKEEKLITVFPGQIQFKFIDHQGKEYSNWPPKGTAQYREIPSSIILIDTRGSAEILKFIAYEGYLTPPQKNMSDFFPGT